MIVLLADTRETVVQGEFFALGPPAGDTSEALAEEGGGRA